jgi:hypothetical protein
MAKSDCTVSHPVLNVGISLEILHVAALASRDKGGRKDRILIITFGVRVSASGYEVVGASLELPGGGELIRSATQGDLLARIWRHAVTCRAS